jgi:hypothetical protein
MAAATLGCTVYACIIGNLFLFCTNWPGLLLSVFYVATCTPYAPHQVTGHPAPCARAGRVPPLPGALLSSKTNPPRPCTALQLREAMMLVYLGMTALVGGVALAGMLGAAQQGGQQRSMW